MARSERSEGQLLSGDAISVQTSLMADINTDFFVALAAAAPVIALSATVQVSDSTRALERAVDLAREIEPDSVPTSLKTARRFAMVAFLLTAFNIFLQAIVFVGALIALALFSATSLAGTALVAHGSHQGIFGYSFKTFLYVSLIEGLGLWMILINTLLISTSQRKSRRAHPIPTDEDSTDTQ
jgi:hypothetical protein